MLHSRKRRDAFVHATARIDAVQSLRVALKDMHIDQLLGKYEIREPERPKYSGPFSQNPRQTGVFDLTPAQMAFRRVEREKAALDQISATTWVVDALKFLNGNRLLACPEASQRLDRAALPLTDPKCLGSKRFRVLDLGGNTSCDWAWHCAHKWPNVKVYTVVSKSQTSTTHLQGPPNHRQVSVPHVWQLPFRDAHFDVISARNLHAMLRHEPVPGQTQIDEYDLCLKECMRVLKPGGYLEYLVMDASIAHAGPLGSAMSVEFGFNLKTRGYDAVPTKVFLRRLRKSGFVGLKRAWMFLPMGSARRENVGKIREAPEPEVKSIVEGQMEAVLGPVGSTGDVANVSGLLGGWMWEQWMLKLQMEMGREKGKLLEGVAAVFEEGRACGSGWRVLNGWARKPRDSRAKGTIKIKIDAQR
jgi:SAM-dependent methyltransferase